MDNITEKVISSPAIVTGNPFTITGIVDEEYRIERINIPGYRLDETRLPDNEEGVFTEEGDTVRYYYIELRTYDLDVLYVLDDEPVSGVELNITKDDEESTTESFISDDNNISPTEYADRKLLRQELENLMKDLTDREEQVIRLRYGFDDGIS